MSLNNETLVSSLKKSSLVEDEYMLRISDTKVWLLIHLVAVRFIEISIYYTEVIFPLLCIIIVHSSRRWNSIRIIIMDNDWLNTNAQEGNLHFILLKQEIKLILIYVYSSIVYKWLQLSHSSSTITLLNIIRWSNEASNVPFALLYTFVLSQNEFIENFLSNQFFYVLRFLLKLPLFFMMRHSESCSDFIVNDLQMYLLEKICKTA